VNLRFHTRRRGAAKSREEDESDRGAEVGGIERGLSVGPRAAAREK